MKSFSLNIYFFWVASQAVSIPQHAAKKENGEKFKRKVKDMAITS